LGTPSDGSEAPPLGGRKADMQYAMGKETTYLDWKAKNDDSYGGACFQYAEKWAELLEAAITSGQTLEDVADRLSHKADQGIGITGFQYGAAASILSTCWIHGEQLRRWHNLKTQIQHEGEEANKQPDAVLNPAILNIG